MKKKALTRKTVNKRPEDINQIAHALVRQSTQEQPEPSKEDISRVMAVLGKKGGLVGGKKRAESLTGERKRQIALKAARARWDKSAKKDVS